MMKLLLKFFPRIGMLIVLPLLALSALMLNAQDATDEANPTDVVTAEATESPLPTDIPTEIPSLEPVVTETATVLPATDDATAIPVTEDVTEEPETGIVPEAAFSPLVRELFDNGDVSPWSIGAGWALVASEGGQAFQTSGTEALELLKGAFYNVAAQADFLSETGTANLSIRNSEAGNYSLSLSPDGTVGLYRAENLVASGFVAASTSGQWRTLRISALEGVVRAAIDNTEVLVYADSGSLPSGTVLISASFANAEATNSLLMDNFFLSVPVDELVNYPAPTAFAPPATTEAPPQETELAPTETAGEEIKDYSPFPAPSAEELGQAQLMSTLGNDNFDGLEILFVPYTVSDNTIGDTLEIGEPASGCGIGMSNTVWFKYTPSISGSYRFSSSGSNFDTILAVYTGASVDALTQVACNDDISATDLDSQFTANLVSSTTYYIQLGGFNGRYGNYSLTVQLLGIAAPTVPTLASPANATRTNDTTPTLDWNAALNVHQYELQWATNATFTANLQKAFILDPATDYTLPTLNNTNGTVYYWRVRSINGSGVASAFSAVRNFTLDTTPLGVPNLTAPANAVITTNSRPALSWSAITGASYLLDLDNDSDFSSPILNNQVVNTANYTPPTPFVQGTYYWRVQSRDNAMNASTESTVRSFTVKILTAPSNNSVIFTNTGNASPVLTWAAVSGVTSYTVQIDDDTDFSADLVADVPLGNVLTYTVSPALATGIYYWQVVPTGFAQITAVYNTFTISEPALAAPSLASPDNAARTNDASPELSWNSVTTAYQYEVQWATNTAFTLNMGSAIVNAPDTLHTLPTLPNSAGTVYYWRVRTINNLGVAGTYSGARNFTLDTSPTAAANLTAPANGAISTNSRPTFTFQAVSGAQDYFIDIDNDSDFSSYEQSHQFFATSFTLSSSLPQGTYYWRVRVQDNAGNISTSASRTITIKILTAPANNTIIFTGTGDASPILTWAAVVEAAVTGYTVQIDDDTDFSADLVVDVAVGNVLTYTVSPALTTGVYYWQVFPTGFAPANAVYSTFTISPAALAAPNLSNPANAARTSDSTPNVSWDSVASAYQYEVQWATNATFTANSVSALVNDPTTSHTLPTLPNSAGTVYYWRVRTINSFGVAGAYSTARNFTLDTTAPDVPAQVAPADNLVSTNSRPVLSWTAETGASGYVLDLADNSSFINPILNGLFVATTSYTPATPLVQGTYYWRVLAVDSVENTSGHSPVRSFTIKILSSPANNAIITTATGTSSPLLRWIAVTGATGYTIQIDDDTDFSADLLFDQALGNVLSYQTSSLNTGVYYWQVIPTGFEQTTAVYSSFTISPGALVASRVFTPANGTYINDTTPEVTWGSVTNAYQYEVQWATNTAFTLNMGSAIVNAPTTSHSLPLLPGTAGTVYYWRLRVINAVGVAGPYSPIWNFRLDTVAPNTPVLVSPANGSTTMTNPVQFRWNAAAGAFRYEIRYGTTNPPTIVVANLSATSYTSPSPLLMQNYYWQVRAVDAAGNTSAWTDVREVKINSGTTAAPIPNRFTTTSPTLNWTPISWTSTGGYYQVQVDNNNSFASPEFINNSISSASPSVMATGLSNGTWYWRVRACNVANVCGAWSTVGVFTIEA